jgi:hypothetical protein
MLARPESEVPLILLLSFCLCKKEVLTLAVLGELLLVDFFSPFVGDGPFTV